MKVCEKELSRQSGRVPRSKAELLGYSRNSKEVSLVEAGGERGERQEMRSESWGQGGRSYSVLQVKVGVGAFITSEIPSEAKGCIFNSSTLKPNYHKTCVTKLSRPISILNYFLNLNGSCYKLIIIDHFSDFYLSHLKMFG